jgi:3-dehydroquinate synthase class II
LVPVTSLKVGDEVLVHHEDAARHFGMSVQERLEER